MVFTFCKNQIMCILNFVYIYQFYLVKILSLLFIYYTMIVFQPAACSIHNNLWNCILSDTKYQIPQVYKAVYKAHTRLHFFGFFFLIFSTMVAVKQCPNTSEVRTSRSNINKCQTLENYHCLKTEDGQLRELCTSPIWIEAGRLNNLSL